MLMVLNCPVPTEVDDIDFDYLAGLTFTLNNGYLRCRSAGKHLDWYIHEIIIERMGVTDYDEIDHDDQDKMNNRRYNLRPATYSQNRANSKRRINNKSGTTGVHFCQREQKWQAGIGWKGEDKHSPYFEDREDAIRWREVAEEKYFKEFNPNRSAKNDSTEETDNPPDLYSLSLLAPDTQWYPNWLFKLYQITCSREEKIHNES